MSLFAISDTHLSLGTDKPMDIFNGWDNYLTRLENNWNNLVKDDDTVVIPGDISWSMKLDNCFDDFLFINSLKGKKIFLKGNHDYWWSTKSKMDKYLFENQFNSISILFNNAYRVDNISICGTRGWLLESESEEDIKILNREVGRLETSIKCALKLGGEPNVFLHYPPVCCGTECSEIVDLLQKYDIKKCYYGHLHGTKIIKNAYEGFYKGIEMKLISCDSLNFIPLLIR